MVQVPSKINSCTAVKIKLMRTVEEAWRRDLVKTFECDTDVFIPEISRLLSA